MKICIGTITRNRPDMLRALLASYGRMRMPDGVEIIYAIAENNPEVTIHAVVEEMRPALGGHRLLVEAEPRRGIPFARNHVLDMALAEGADYLTFVDDDEQVDADWLVNLLRMAREGDYDLVGAPVLIRDMPAGACGLAAILWRGMVRRNAHVAKKARRRFAKKGPNSINVSTANWLGRLDFFRRTGLRFDDGIGQGSGSDRRLYKDLVAKGGKAGWTIDAPVYDTVPLSRLTLSYQFKRGREHTAYLFADSDRTGSMPRIMLLAKALGRIPRILASLVAIPFTGGESLLMASRLAGDMVGFIDAYRGVFGSHYANVTGQ
ncbi:glycosyltransferase involved in cell wall biosynthesis [Rhizobium sp. SG_E_25_P2]|uniref:glycosyltransferase family 2 protein n=1 Tax=Rhizobium sp. SG_E_25_P2 TaxID=2879942 RepID=UPI0024771A76|nr:glycosyltransferase [Rhizobium sp. SG_E_25_P2]MDH6266942.1 glycosyltransferase involved in cell wall biosynthesis [Rhizobium sp. SG_E_25_P2]